MSDLRIKKSAQSDAVWHLLIQWSAVALLALLVVAYATGEEYPHTHAMIGYSIAVVVMANLVWLAVFRRDRTLPAPYTPGAMRMKFQNAGGLAKTLALLIAFLAALPLCALFVMLVTHTLLGATAVDEMHEVVAYFALGLVAVHGVMVGIASSSHIGDHLRNFFGHSRRPH